MAEEPLNPDLGVANDPAPDNAPGTGNAPEPDVADWFSAVPKEYASEKLWEPVRNKPLSEVLKSYAEAQKLIGSSVRIPNEKASEEEWNKFYAKLGRPEKPEGYKIDLDLVPEELRDPDFEKGFREVAYRTGLSAKQAEALAGWYNQLAVQKIAESRKAAREDLNRLLDEWGGAAKRNVALAKRAVDHLGGEELRTLFNNTGLGDNPAMVKLFARIGQLLLENGLVDDITGPGMSDEEALKKAHEIIFDETHPDHRAYVDASDPRHREVVDAVERLFQQHYHRPKI